jgi:hypothetical protein
MTHLKLTATIAAVISLTACGNAAVSSPPAPATSPASPAAAHHAAEPATAAGARAAAVRYFDLYAAHQYAASWPMLSHAARRDVSRNSWTKIHQECITTSGLAYKIGHIVLAGHTAVVKVSLAGVASKLGSEEQSFAYQHGKWHYVPSDLPVYKGHTVTQAVADLRAQQICSS